MALPALEVSEVKSMDAKARMRYFEKYARRINDAPIKSRDKYAIRVGSQTLYSNDTHDLRGQFDDFLEK